MQFNGRLKRTPLVCPKLACSARVRLSDRTNGHRTNGRQRARRLQRGVMTPVNDCLSGRNMWLLRSEQLARRTLSHRHCWLQVMADGRSESGESEKLLLVVEHYQLPWCRERPLWGHLARKGTLSANLEVKISIWRYFRVFICVIPAYLLYCVLFHLVLIEIVMNIS